MGPRPTEGATAAGRGSRGSRGRSISSLVSMDDGEWVTSSEAFAIRGAVRRAKARLQESALAQSCSDEDGVFHKRVLQDALKESKRRWGNCMMLPVMWFYFIFYALAASLLEDPEQRHLVETPVREALMPMLEEDQDPTASMLQGVSTLPEVWEFIDKTYIPLFFARADSMGNPLPEDEWGTMYQFSQMLGVAKMELQRSAAKGCADVSGGTSSFFGIPMCFADDCQDAKLSHLICHPVTELTSEPFGTPWDQVPNVSSTSAKEHYLGASLSGGAGAILNCEGEAFTTQGCDVRRLAYLREDFGWLATFAGFLAPMADDEASTYLMHLDARDPLARVQARIKYLQDRDWLDESTTALSLKALYLNADLDAPWIVQVEISFAFSRGGGVFTFLDMTSFTTSFWGSSNMSRSICFSALFVACLIVSTYSLRHQLVQFFQSKRDRDDFDWAILWNVANFVTLVSIVFGWATIVMYFMKKSKLDSVVEAIQEYDRNRADGSAAHALKLHDAVDDMVGLLATLRNFIALATLVFNLRAFVSLQFQPRLAVVIRTLIESSSDMFHFMIIMLSTVIAFAFSGVILYGKRLQDFATPWAAFMVCFKIMVENEYKWDELSADPVTYHSALMWTMVYLCIGVLLLLNMVLAIIMDVYQEVRQESGDSMTIVADAVYLYHSFRYRGSWISERHIIKALSAEGVDDYLTTADLVKKFPEMHQYQLDYILQNCRNKAKRILRIGIKDSETSWMVAAIHLSLEEVQKDTALMKERGWLCKGLEVDDAGDREHVKDILSSLGAQKHWMDIAQQNLAALKQKVCADPLAPPVSKEFSI